MPRTELPVTAVDFPNVFVSKAVTWTAADAVNGNQYSGTGQEVVLARNTGAGARNIAYTSAPVAGRLGSIPNQSIAAGATHVLPFFGNLGTVQADGKVYLNADHAEVLIAVLRLPPGVRG